MGFGKAPVPKGSLPIFSVNSEDEAYRLLVVACPRTADGHFIARELATEQTLKNLYRFGDRLHTIYNMSSFRKEPT